MRINSRHTDAECGLDAYFTPPCATTALLHLEKLPKVVIDPACGNGAILKVLSAAGHITHAADIKDYGYPYTKVQNYLAESFSLEGMGIVTNPPYKLALQFAQKALADKADIVALLLRLNFLESSRRLPFFRLTPPARVWVSSRRLPMMHRHGWTGPEAPSNCCYAWYVWGREPAHRPAVDWFDWKDFM